MAWLQNLAGRAEDLLNKVDQNAARVLNEPIVETTNSQLLLARSPDLLKDINVIEPISPIPPSDEANSASVKIDLEPQISSVSDEAPQQEKNAIDMNASNSSNIFEKVKSMTDSIGVMSVSSSNSLNIDTLDPQMTVKLEAQIARLEVENEMYSMQILNLQHMHSELQHDYSNVQAQLDRANETVQATQNEMQEYRARARRILDDREKALPQQYSENPEVQEISQINQELKNDLDNAVQNNETLQNRLNAVSKELSGLQQQYLSIQKETQRMQDGLRASLQNEKKAREDIEEENRSTARELQRLDKELKHAKKQESVFKTEIENLNQQLRLRPVRNSQDADTQLHLLTQTLMHKQNTLDTLTSERNALKIQLEKLEHQYAQLCSERVPRLLVQTYATNDYDARIPKLLQVSPLDAGVTQRVKHAYSTLDAFSIRTGVFLRRYPFARIFLICYMMMLHLWVLLILFTYVPATR